MFPFSSIGIFIVLLFKSCVSYGETEIDLSQPCDRRPLGTKTDPLPPDNQFVLDIEGIKDNNYIPDREYDVHLHSRDGKATFIAFTISLQEDSIPNKANSRKRTYLKAGSLMMINGSTQLAQDSPSCRNTLIENDITPKTSVRVRWRAPDKDNKCVTIFAVVAVKQNVWYSFQNPLSKRVCEDPRKADDMPPTLSDDCKACEEARYELVFEGLWSYNTHPKLFPSKEHPARFSDTVGASHSAGYTLFKYNSDASLGLRMLAEQGNTTRFEIEIQENLGTKVRTVIKATSPEQANMSTITSFRATPEHHRLSLASGILPSPDWFLGVSNLELCNADSKWSKEIKLNLYPLDAGTDKGTDFESPNEETSPAQPIAQVVFKETKKEDVKAFARIHVNLIRTYPKPECIIESAVTEEQDEDEQGEGEGEDEGDDGNGEEQDNSVIVIRPTTTSEEPPVIDPDSSDDCPMTQWEDWQDCQGECDEPGIQIRFRQYIIDGEPVKYNDNGPTQQVPQDCLDKYSELETRACTVTCEEQEEEEGEDGEIIS